MRGGGVERLEPTEQIVEDVHRGFLLHLERTCATMRSTVGNNASSDCVSSFSTALMNPLRFSRLFAKSTLRRGTPPVASPPCLNRFATPSRSVSSAFSAASAARADVASASARRRCSDVSGSSASASTFSDRSCA